MYSTVKNCVVEVDMKLVKKILVVASISYCTFFSFAKNAEMTPLLRGQNLPAKFCIWFKPVSDSVSLDMKKIHEKFRERLNQELIKEGMSVEDVKISDLQQSVGHENQYELCGNIYNK